MATMEQQKADENVLKLVEEHKVRLKVKYVLFHVISRETNIWVCYCVEMQREKQAALGKILRLQQQLDAKQKLELEVQTLESKMKVMMHMPGDQDSESKKKMDELAEELKEKVDELEAMESLNQTLIIKERKSNDELQHARKELIDVSYHIDWPAIRYYALLCCLKSMMHILSVLLHAFRALWSLLLLAELT